MKIYFWNVDSLLLSLGVLSNIILIALEHRNELELLANYLRSCSNYSKLKEIARNYCNPKNT